MRFVAIITIFVSLSAVIAAEPGTNDPKQTDEYRLLERVITAYRAGRSHEVRPLLTDGGKRLSDRLSTIAWIEKFEFTPLDIRRNLGGPFGIGAHNELRFRAAGAGQQFYFVVTFFFEGSILRVHDVFVEDPVNQFLSARPVLPEIRCVAAARKMRDSAKLVVSDPSNWKDGAKQMADFREAAVALGWLDRPAVKKFREAGDDMVQFATTWHQTIEDAMSDKTNEELQKELETAIQAELSKDPKFVLEAKVETVEKFAKQISRSLGRRIEKLSPGQSAEFGKRQKPLNDAYENVLRLVGESRLLVETEPGR